jgi:hypothetical protein
MIEMKPLSIENVSIRYQGVVFAYDKNMNVVKKKKKKMKQSL